MKEEENHKDVAEDEEVKVKEEARSSRMKEEECENLNENDSRESGSNSGMRTSPQLVEQQEERRMKEEKNVNV